jgi:phosphoenolpyruvate synthase/pyruvate phosphate dikinase
MTRRSCWKAILEYPHIDALAEGAATIGAAFWPKPVIVRLSDFKSNEYNNLIGGSWYEPDDAEPAIKACRAKGKYIGICSRGPSDHPAFAQWLVEQGIEPMSLNPGSMIDTWHKPAGV